jgi:polysaccharide pyruvyl transferase WcaK-like protein
MTGQTGPDGPRMRILVQNGEYLMRNIGDLAMLSVTLRRLRERWPTAALHVMTSAPALLRAYHPDVHPVSDGRMPAWLSDALATAGARLGPGIAGVASMGSLRASEGLKDAVAWLGAARRTRPAPEAANGHAAEAARQGAMTQPVVADAVQGASLVLAMGGGYMTDVDPWQVHRTLDLLQSAVDRGIPTAMVGQGFGPLTDEALIARASAVLPAVDVIALREDRAGPDLLARLGVRADRVVVTGDDAIELAYSVRQNQLGTNLGVCLRVAEYSPVAARAQEAVGAAVRAVAGGTGARLAPLIVSEYRAEDRRSTLPLVAGYPDVVLAQGRFATPQEVARRVGGCRVLVTGAYHLAVFALSQGIPVVGLSSSRYYDDKLLGLDAMFGGHGLHVVRLDEPDLEDRVASAARAAWERAPDLRSQLRRRANAQIELSVNAFERVCSHVDETSAR